MFFKVSEMFETKKVAHLGYNDGFGDKQQFSIPKEFTLLFTQQQQAKFNIEESTAGETFAITPSNQDTHRKVYYMNGDEESVRELHSILKTSGLGVVYLFNGAHQLVNDSHSLIEIMKAEKIRHDDQNQKYVSTRLGR